MLENMNNDKTHIIKNVIRLAKGVLSSCEDWIIKTSNNESKEDEITLVEFIQVTTEAWNKLLESKKIQNK